MDDIFLLQKPLFSHPDSYNIKKKSGIREALTLSTDAHSSNNTIKYLPSVTCSMSRFMRHMSLVTNNNDHSLTPSPPNFPIIHNRLIYRGVAQKKGKLNLKS